MEILIISGLSGSGKSRAAAFLEDAGYYTVDNLPAEMMLRFADFCAAAGLSFPLVYSRAFASLARRLKKGGHALAEGI